MKATRQGLGKTGRESEKNKEMWDEGRNEWLRKKTYIKGMVHRKKETELNEMNSYHMM